MKKELYLLAGLTLSATALPAENVCISTQKTSMVINATQGQELKFVYYGEKLSAGDLSNLDHSGRTAPARRHWR